MSILSRPIRVGWADRAPACEIRIMIPRPSSWAAVLLVLCAPAFAQTDRPLLSVAEARTQGRRALLERRWDDAIAAFAQTVKTFPAPWVGAEDPRNQVLLAALREILHDLDARGAPTAEKLPYWDFCWRGYPYFSGNLLDLNYDAWQPDWLTAFRQAAEGRVQGEDPPGTNPRFDLCRRLAKLPADVGAAEAVRLLEVEWPAGHADHGLCAYHALRILERLPARRDDEVEPQADRAWAAYVKRFASSPLLGAAACRWGRLEEGLAAATDPVARRWIALARLQANPEDRPLAETADRCRLAIEVSRPWIPEAMARVWVVNLCMREPDRDVYSPATARTQVEEMRRAFPDSRELGLACFTVFRLAWGGLDQRERPTWLREFIARWESFRPDDPYLEWAKLIPLEDRQWQDPQARLTAGEIVSLRAIAGRDAEEPIGWLAASLLAEDEVRGGDFAPALARYETLARMDPARARLPAPLPGDDTLSLATSRLQEYYSTRDPRRAIELERKRFEGWGGKNPYGNVWICGNWGEEFARAQELRKADLLARAGEVEAALEVYWQGIAGDSHSVDLRAAVGFADLSTARGQKDRIREAAARLRLLDEDPWARRERVVSNHAIAAKTFENYLAVLALARRSDVDGIVRLLEGPGDGGTDTIVRAVRRVPACADALLRRLPSIAWHPRVLLACAVDGEVALETLIDEFVIEESAEGPARIGMERHPLEAMRSLLRRVAALGPACWASLRERVGFLPAGARWTAFGELRAHVDPGVRDLAEMEQKLLERDSPWEVFCVRGK